MPDARSRSSSTAACALANALVDQLQRAAGVVGSRSRASWSSIISATSRCCAPSCRSRPSRRRSASPASTSRARDARSASSRARSSTSSRPFSSASAAAALASPQQLRRRRPAPRRGRARRRAAPRGRSRSPLARRPRRQHDRAAVAVDVAAPPPAASRRPSSVGSPSASRERVAHPARRGRARAARSAARPWRCGRSGCARARARTRRAAARTRTGTRAASVLLLHDEERPPPSATITAPSSEHRVEPAPLDRARRRAGAGPAARRWRAAPRARRRSSSAADSRRRTPGSVGERRARPPNSTCGACRTVAIDVAGGDGHARSRRPASRPDGNASRRWTSSATISVSHSAAEHERERGVRELQARRQRREADRDHQRAGAVVGAAEPREAACRDEPPGPRDPEIGDRDPALGQVVGAGRERQHRRAEGDGEHAEGGRGAAPGPQAELSHAGTSSRRQADSPVKPSISDPGCG